MLRDYLDSLYLSQDFPQKSSLTSYDRKLSTNITYSSRVRSKETNIMLPLLIVGLLAVISSSLVNARGLPPHGIQSRVENHVKPLLLRLSKRSAEYVNDEEFESLSMRFKRQESTLQEALQNLQQTQQQQSQQQRRPGQSGNQGQGGFGNQGFNGGGQGSNGQNGQNTGFTGGFSPDNGFNQGFPSNNGQNQGNVGGGFGNSNQNQGGQGWTTVRNPLNLANDENTIPEAECVRRCPAVNNFNPVCGSDNVTYSNEFKLRCAVQCRRQVSISYRGTCVTTRAPNQ